MSGRHYWLIQIGSGKGAFERVYQEMTSPEESPEDGLARYIEAQVKAGTNAKSRASTIEKVRAAAVATVEYIRPCRPTSWYRDAAERQGLPFPAPVPGARSRSRRR